MGIILVLLAVTSVFAQKKSVVPETRIPVILIHGIGGSDLRQPPVKGLFTDGGFPNDVLVGKAGDPYKLQFDSSGNPRRDTISKTVEAVGFYDVPLSKNITDLSKYLRERGYALDRDLFEFAYDFRYSVPHNAGKLGALIERAKNTANAQKVDIVGHSMGGLVAKAYLSDPVNAANVRNLVFVGTPHLGAPKALKALRYGDDLGVKIIDGCKLKRAVHNMPGMLNLLPGKRYFEVKGGYFIDADDLDGDSEKGLLGYEQMLVNLKDGKETKCLLDSKIDVASYDKDAMIDRLNGTLVSEHVIEFHAWLDSWAKPAGVTVFSVVGYGNETIESLKESGGGVTYVTTKEGDGTVPLWSSEAVESDHVYFVNVAKLKVEHSVMIGSSSFAAQILGLLRNGPGIYMKETSTARPLFPQEGVAKQARQQSGR